jgi:hypothetical protein
MKFTRKTTQSVLAVFHKAVADLDQIEQAAISEANKADDARVMAIVDMEDAKRRATEAKSVRERISDLIAG